MLLSMSFSVLTKFETIFMRWRLFLRITLSLLFNNVWDRCILFLLRIIPVCVQLYSGDNGPCCFCSIVWSSLDWLTISFVIFVLVFTFTFSECTSVCNFLFICIFESHVPMLLLVVRSANMAKYGSLLSSLHSCRVFLMVWKDLFTNPLLWGNSGLGVLCIKSYDLENFLNSCELYWGPLSLNTTLGVPCRANILLI